MMAKQRVALEILSYHATAPDEETNKLKVSFQVQKAKANIARFPTKTVPDG